MIRLGIVGHGGRVAGLVRDTFRALDPDIRVTGIVDPDPKAAMARLDERDRGQVKFYDTLAEMMRRAKPDGLMIGTRCNLHTPYAIEAAKFDVPLFLEKPVATSMTQAVALEKAYRKAKCTVVVSFPLRVSPLCCLARKLIADKAVGTPEHILAVNYVPYGTIYWEDGYRDFETTQGLFLQKATHDFDYISLLMGSPIVRVAAKANYGRVFGGKKPATLRCADCGERRTCLESPENRKRNGSGGSTANHLCDFSAGCGSPETGINEDCSSALLEFASGAHGVYTQVFFTRRDAGARGSTVSGYHGTVSFDWYRNEVRYVRHHAPFTDTSKADSGMGHFGGDMELARNFLGLIGGTDKKSRTPIETGIQSVYACLAAKESAQTGRFVNVRQVRNPS